ncbi:MAG: tRNA lysidine(34) synthetase TilS, partial [Parasporobacterium sp.]|nr:tRNA lysidine(34) synthetase TilS [Parasporobacterium sp.]
GRRIQLPYNVEASRGYNNIMLRRESPMDRSRKDMDTGRLFMTENSRVTFSAADLENAPAEFEVPGYGTLRVCIEAVTEANRGLLTEKNRYTKAFDYDRIKGVLTLGKAEPDDYIRFSKGAKSIKKFFVDEKVPRELRDKIPVLKDDSGVLWIVGYRIGEQYKITDSTTKALTAEIIGGQK